MKRKLNTGEVNKPPKSLYTPAEVKEVRLALLKEQKGLDALTGLPLPITDSVCDHDHKTQFVRGILHRQSNALLGKIENLYNRYLSWWYNGTLSDFLRSTATYLDRKQPEEYVHPGWLKRVATDFKALTAAQQTKVLKELGGENGSNATERLKLFKARILDRSLGYVIIRTTINSVKEKP